MSDEPREYGEEGRHFRPPKNFRGMYLQIGDSNSPRGSRVTARLVFGLLIFALGTLWTLDNLGVIDSGPIMQWWPSLLILLGIGKITGAIPRRQVVMGSVFAIVGLLLLGNSMDWFSFHFWQLWPLFLIAAGTSLVVRSMRGPAAADGTDRSAEVHSFAMMAGIHQKFDTQDFRGGDASALMGGVEIDLRSARATQPQVVIDVFAWWGGIDIFIPRDWRVVNEVVPIMGGVDDQTRPAEGDIRTTLVLRGAAIMGGIEIKS